MDDTPGTEAVAPTPSSAPSAQLTTAAWAERLWAKRALLVGIGFFVVGVIVAERIRPVILYDDAAIIGRYIRRIVAGDGWTYNDGDRTNGLSAPLYGMVGAVLHAGGLDPIVALRVICTFSYAATIGLVAYLGTRIVGLVGGIAAGAFLLVWYDFATQGLSGMESAFATLLGTAVLVALVHDRETWAGVFLGLAVMNKLDAGLLALAVAVAYLVILRRPPWRIAAVSSAVLLPWLVFSTLYFGSPLPHSFTQKTSGVGGPEGVDLPITWVLQGLQDQEVTRVVALAAMGVVVVVLLARRQKLAPAVALLTALLWALTHGAAFSLLDLGDPYPWYLTALYPPMALSAGCAIGYAYNRLRLMERSAAIPALVGAVLLFVLATRDHHQWGRAETLVERYRSGRHVSDYLELDMARREAGALLADLAQPDEVVSTCFGWIAYEAHEQQIAETCPLNTRKPVGPPDWSVEVAWPVTIGVNDVPPPFTVASTYSDGEIDDGRVDIIPLTP